jgi:hypothetical protein
VGDPALLTINRRVYGRLYFLQRGEYSHRTIEKDIQMDLIPLDSEIARVTAILRLARECGFARMVAVIEREIVEMTLPAMTLMACDADGRDRKKIATRRARLARILG